MNKSIEAIEFAMGYVPKLSKASSLAAATTASSNIITTDDHSICTRDDHDGEERIVSTNDNGEYVEMFARLQKRSH
jgi:hypothetical protein